MLSDSLTGIVCSIEKNEFYCLKGSRTYKAHFQNRNDVDIFYISSGCLKYLMSMGNPSDWDIELLLKLKVEK